MKLSPKVVAVTLIAMIIGFLTESHGPLGSFWAPDPAFPLATGFQIPLFMLLGVIEALAFGVGISFLLFGYPVLRGIGNATAGATRGVHLAISWILINWWAHDSLHIHNGMDLNGLLRIEYGFHVTLIISGLLLARFFLALLQPPAAA